MVFSFQFNAVLLSNSQYGYMYGRYLNIAFQLKSYKKETENKTIRFPVALIEKIERAIQNQDVTFSSFVLQACEHALNDMISDKNNPKK